MTGVVLEPIGDSAVDDEFQRMTQDLAQAFGRTTAISGCSRTHDGRASASRTSVEQLAVATDEELRALRERPMLRSSGASTSSAAAVATGDRPSSHRCWLVAG